MNLLVNCLQDGALAAVACTGYAVASRPTKAIVIVAIATPSAQAVVAATKDIPVVYSGAKTGEDEYVSVILADRKGKALYYGNIANDSAASPDTGQTVKIPEGLAAGSYTMYLFNEQINGDKRTDYASDFSTIELSIEDSMGAGALRGELHFSHLVALSGFTQPQLEHLIVIIVLVLTPAQRVCLSYAWKT